MMAKMLFAAGELGCGEEARSIACMLSVQQVWQVREWKGQAEVLRRKFAVREGDHLTLLNVNGSRLTGTPSSESPSRVEDECALSRNKPYASVRALSEANCVCADCGRRDPEWTAYNLGVIICQDCSGVHRSLGTHVSRVRSLTLDQWDSETLFLLKQLGNGVANAVWEAALTNNADATDDDGEGVKKPTETSERTARERYIRAKYVARRFVTKPPAGVEEEALTQLLHAACTHNDYAQILRLLAQGASATRPLAGAAHSASLLHLLITEGKCSTASLELVCQNTAKLMLQDDRGWTALAYAAAYDRAHYARMLIKLGAPTNTQDKDGRSVLDIAQLHKSKAVLRFLTTGEMDPELPSVNADANERERLNQYKEAISDSLGGTIDRLLELRTSAVEWNEPLLIDLVKRLRLVKMTLADSTAPVPTLVLSTSSTNSAAPSVAT